MTKHTKINFIVILSIILLLSCNKKDNYHMPFRTVEIILNEHPQKAYNKLKNLNIKNAPDSLQMYYQILLCRAEDLCYVPHQSDSAMLNVAKYYKCEDYKVGHLMEAYYCLGCIYRDLHQAKDALKYYHMALDLVPYNKNNVLIGRIYNQMAQILEVGYSEKEALQAYQKSVYYFKKGKDYRVTPLAESDLARIYESTDDDNKRAIIYYDNAIRDAIKLNDNMIIASTMLAKIQFCMGYDDYKGARYIYNNAKRILPPKCMNQYGFYICKGKLDYVDKNYQSAIRNLNIAAQDIDKSRKADAYLNLKDIYQNGLKDDSKALAYADSAINLIDSIRLEANDKEVHKMQALYDYKLVQNKNLQLSLENLESKYYLQIAIICILLLSSVWIIWLMQVKRKKVQLQKTIAEKDKQYRQSIDYIKNNEEIINKLKHENDELSSLRINYLKQNNDKIKLEVERQTDIWKDFRTCSIYNSMHQMINDNDCQQKEIKELFIKLKECIDIYFDNYSYRLRQYYPSINDTQINICYLIKADFKPSNIAIVLSKTKAAITNARNGIRRNCFDSSTSLDEVDNFIHDL